MSLLVDTSVWSMALRRDAPPDLPEVRALGDALASGELVVTTGLILQEILQGFSGPRARDAILGRFHPLLAALCLRHGLSVLTTDADFRRIAEVSPLSVWSRS